MMPPIPRQITIPAAANTHTIPMVRQSMLIKELRINEVSGTQTNTMADMPANLKKILSLLFRNRPYPLANMPSGITLYLTELQFSYTEFL